MLRLTQKNNNLLTKAFLARFGGSVAPVDTNMDK